MSSLSVLQQKMVSLKHYYARASLGIHNESYTAEKMLIYFCLLYHIIIYI